MKTREVGQAWQDSGEGSVRSEQSCSCEEDGDASWCQVPPDPCMHGPDSRSLQHKGPLRISERSLLWVLRHPVNYLNLFLLLSIQPLTTSYQQGGRLAGCGPQLLIRLATNGPKHTHTGFLRTCAVFHSVSELLSDPDSLWWTGIWTVDNRRSRQKQTPAGEQNLRDHHLLWESLCCFLLKCSFSL